MREFKKYSKHLFKKREKVDVSRRPPEVRLCEGDVTDQISIGLWEEAARGCASKATAAAGAVGANEIFAAEAGPLAASPLASRLISEP